MGLINNLIEVALDYASRNSPRTRELEAELETHRKEDVSQREQIIAQQGQIEEQQSQIKTLDTVNNSLTDSNKRLTQELHDNKLNYEKTQSENTQLRARNTGLTIKNEDLEARCSDAEKKHGVLKQNYAQTLIVQSQLLAQEYLNHAEFFKNLGIEVSPALEALASNYKQTAETLALRNEELRLEQHHINERDKEIQGLFKQLLKVGTIISEPGVDIGEQELPSVIMQYCRDVKNTLDQIAETGFISAVSGESPRILGVSNLLLKSGLSEEIIHELSERQKSFSLRNEQYVLKMKHVGDGIYIGGIRERRVKGKKPEKYSPIHIPLPAVQPVKINHEK